MKISKQRIICSFIFVVFLVIITGISRAEDTNMSFVGHIGGSISDVTVAGNHAYVGEGQDFVVLDITDVNNPIEVGKVTTPELLNDIAISGDYAYITENVSLVILDISDPSSPRNIGSYRLTNSLAGSVTVSGDYAYVSCLAGFIVLDVSNPSTPTLAGRYTYTTYPASYTSDIIILGDYAYVPFGDWGLHIVDISNPSSPTRISRFNTQVGRVAISGDYAYATRGDNGLVIIDISNLSSPTLVGSYNPTDARPTGIAVSGNYAYIANANSGDNGLTILDVTNVSSPKLVGRCNTGYSTYLMLANNQAYVVNSQTGLAIVDVADESSPKLLGSYNSIGGARDVAVSGNYAYVADGSNGLSVIDITDPSLPKFAGEYYNGGTTCAVAVSGNYAYLASGDDKLVIVDISNPFSPKFASSCNTGFSFYSTDITLANNYAYIAYNGGIAIVDIANPLSPRLIGQYRNANVFATGVVVEGNYAYVAVREGGFIILDITNPSTPTLIPLGSYSTGSTSLTDDIMVSGNYVYLAKGGLSIIDVSNRSAPVVVGKLAVSTQSINISGNYAYVSGLFDGFYVVDTTNVSSPTIVAHYDTAGVSYNSYVKGNYVYEADAGNGLVILKTALQNQEPTEGVLVQAESSPDVYLIKNSTKCHFTSPEALEWNGYSFDDVKIVTSETLQSYPDGEYISISQAIIDKYHELGGAPIFGASAGEGEKDGDKDSAGTYCSYVNFKNGSIEYFKNGDLAGKAYAVFNPFFNKWASMGYAKSILGYPIDNMSNEETSKFGTKFRYQNFANGTEKGAFEYNLTSGNVFEIHGAIFAKWGALGYANSELGLVTSDERDATPSFKGTTGRVSDFENGHLHWHSSGDHYMTTYMTYGDLDKFYVKMGGTASDLGFPVMDQEERDGHEYCEFEGGNISWEASSEKYIVKLNDVVSTIAVGQGASTPEITQKFIDACNRNGGLSVLGNPTTKVHSAFGFEVQDFPEMSATAGGVIMYNPNNNTAYFIHGAIWDRYYNYSDKVKLGSVASDEGVAAIQSGKTTGNYTKFQTGTIHWISDRTGENLGHPQRGKSFVTYGALDDAYTKMGGTYSKLGFPIMDQEERDGHGYCKFEGGSIYWEDSIGAYKIFTKEILIIPAKFSDTPSSNVVPVEDLKKRADLVVDYYDKQSYGKENIKYNFIEDNSTSDGYFNLSGTTEKDFKKESEKGKKSFMLPYWKDALDQAEIDYTLGYDTQGDVISVDVSEYDTAVVAFPVDFKSQALQEYVIVKAAGPYGVWAHELGHSLYGLQDKVGDEQTEGNIGHWGLMGMGYEYNPPTPIIGFDKCKKGWLKYKNISISDIAASDSEYTINYLDDSALYTEGLLRLNTEGLINKYSAQYFIFEGRTKYDSVAGDTSSIVKNNYKGYPLFDSADKGIIIYHVDNSNKIWRETPAYNVIDSVTKLGNDVTISPGESKYLAFYNLKATCLSNGDKLKLKLKRVIPTSYNVWSITTTATGLLDDILSGVPDDSNPDVDLHAITSDGRRIGMDYVNNTYYNEIEGAETSGNLLGGGPEWIAIPDDIDATVYITISPDMKRLLSSNDTSNVEVNSTLMVYDEKGNMQESEPANININSNNLADQFPISSIKDNSPASITNLQSTNGTNWINWTWTNPNDPDFNHTEIYLNGTFETNTSAEYFNATNLQPDKNYTIGTRTVDNNGNVNETWVNSSAKTKPLPDVAPPFLESVVLFPANTTAGSKISVTVNATDNIGVVNVTADSVQLTTVDGLWRGNITAPSSIGKYSLSIKANDAAGNTINTSVPYSVVRRQGGVNVEVLPTVSKVVAGKNATLAVKVKNAQNIDYTFKVRINVNGLPAFYRAGDSWFSWTEKTVNLRAKQEALIPIEVKVPSGTVTGLKVFRANVNSEKFSVRGSDNGYLVISRPSKYINKQIGPRGLWFSR